MKWPRWMLVVLMSASLPLSAQQVGGGGVPGSGGGSGTSQVISSLSYSPSGTTIVASWYTGGTSNSELSCGGKAAVDNNVQTAVTFHQAIVSGLSPSTVYSCTVTSGNTSSTPQNVTTLAAATRTPITAVTFGASTAITNRGDTVKNCVSNDNITYVTEDDGNGFVSGSPNAGANMQIDKLSNESTFTGSLVNLLTNYGAGGTSNGTDGPGGVALSNKLSGLFCMSGDLFAFQSRGYEGAPALHQNQWYGNIMLSKDHGATWNSWQNPPAVSPNGIPPNPLGSYQFATNLYGWINPVRYAMDDGTNGYLTPGNRIDGADAWVYLVSTDGYWNNSSNLYLMRIARAVLGQQNPGSTQYWIGPTSPAPSDFVNDANWSSSAASATAIYSAANEVSDPDLIFIPAMNDYLLLTWYYPNSSITNNTTWVVLSGPTPAGPWTQVATQVNDPTGYYGETVMHRTAATNTGTINVGLTLVYSGDYQGSYYYPTYSSLVLNPADLLDVTPAATFAGSASHVLKSSYVGNLIKIERASDSTTLDIGSSSGVINQSAINTFCSGTTCNVAELYDQTGNGNNCTQATFANMPVIYTAGAIVKNGVNNRVSMYWDNTARWLVCPATLSGTTWESVGVGTTTSGIVQYAGLVILTDGTHSGGSSAATAGMLSNGTAGGGTLSSFYQGASGATSIANVNGTQFYYDSSLSTAAGGSHSLWVNNGSASTFSVTSPGTIASTEISIGGDIPQTTYFWDGYISDVAVYPSLLTTPQRAAAYNIEKQFFGTP